MRIAIGVISIVLSVVVGLQSMLAGLANTLSETGESGGSGGFLLSLCMLIAGIIALASKRNKRAQIVSICFWLFGGFIGLLLAGSYTDLIIWSIISIVFAVVLYFSSVREFKTSNGLTQENE